MVEDSENVTGRQVEISENVTVASSWGARDLFNYGQESTNKARAGRSEKDDGTAEGREGKEGREGREERGGREGFTCSHSDPLDSRV